MREISFWGFCVLFIYFFHHCYYFPFFFFFLLFTQKSWHWKGQFALYQEHNYYFSKMCVLKWGTIKTTLAVLEYSRIKLWSLSCSQCSVLNWLSLSKETKCKNLYHFPKLFFFSIKNFNVKRWKNIPKGTYSRKHWFLGILNLL